MSLNLKQLIGKLNEDCRRAIEAAAGLCLSRTNYNVEIEHWLLKLLDHPQSDFLAIIKAFGISVDRLTADLTRAVDKLRTGNARPPALSQNVVDLIREGWLDASVEFMEDAVRSGHLVYAIVSDEKLNRLIGGTTAEFDKISAEALKTQFHVITKDAAEAGTPTQPTAKSSGGGSGPAAKGGPTKTPSLDQYTIDLTGRAAKGEIDPVLGRDAEIRQVMDILCRRRQNNPILTGEPGVGKTAIAEGFALRIATGDVPPSLKGVSLRTLDLGLLQAGAGMKGEFENRLKAVIEEVKSSPQPIILFIDEAHTLIGAGGSAGQGDAANLLKPALARGELRTIAATTWAEYKKYFERDAALARRFQVVKVDEPTEPSAVAMMRGLVGTLEKHHDVEILSEAVEDAVRLSHRYIAGRLLPDKAVSILDTTCARINLAMNSTPSAIEDCNRRLEQNDVLHKILERESKAGHDHAERVGELAEEKKSVTERLNALTEQLEKEKELVGKIREIRQAYSSNGEKVKDGEKKKPALPPEEALAELKKLEAELKKLQGESPLVHPYVDSQAIAETIESWTGIPVGRMVADEVQTVLKLRSLMEEAIVGQSHALELISQSIQTSRAQLTDPSTPIGVFLLVGTSGVGKTETAITLANLLYGGEQNMTVINMSEFKEEHKVSLLMGSPPGYVGYGEGGVLTEAVRRKPYSVVLLDEMEKAHPGVQDVFYQVFDKGQMKDGEGRDINFRNTVILMTSNAGTDLIKSLCADPDTIPDTEAFTTAVFPELLKTFKPAFLGRCTIVPYYPLSDDVLKRIIRLKLGKIGKRIQANYKATVNFADNLIDSISARCTEVDTGARNIDHILRKSLLPELSSEFLGRLGEGKPISKVTISAGADGKFSYDIA